jgi:hypothetical protein
MPVPCLVNIRLGWKCLAVTNNLAYCSVDSMKAIKSFIVQKGQNPFCLIYYLYVGLGVTGKLWSFFCIQCYYSWPFKKDLTFLSMNILNIINLDNKIWIDIRLEKSFLCFIILVPLIDRIISILKYPCSVLGYLHPLVN